VKICGVTRATDAECAAGLGADFLGLNFWPGSPRHVELAAAGEIAAAALAARSSIRLVGLFVNERRERVEEIVEALGLDFVQLHGDEPEAELARWGDRLVRVVRGDRLARATAEAAPFAYLLDAPRAARRGAAEYGGGGVAWAWGEARAWVEARDRPVLVAGGVRPGNAAAALAASGAAGVDVASGVESAPGLKDEALMRRLIEEVRGEDR
jgi:phosphoribosylanthranilate isomerase